MKYITLDTGFKGGMVLFDNHLPIDAFAFHKVGKGINLHEVDEKIDEWNPDVIYIEIFPPQPYQGVSTTAAQWRVIGALETICQLNCTRVEYIYVATWTSFTKRLSHTPGLPNKKISQELTARYFSKFAESWKKRKLYHDGIADCLAIGIYINRDEYLNDISA